MSFSMSGLNDLEVDSLTAININLDTVQIFPQAIGFIKNLRSSAQNQIDNINVGGGGTGTGPDYTLKFQIIDQEITDLSNNIFTNKLAIVRVNTKIVDLSSNLTISQVDISNNRYNIGLLNTKVLDLSLNLTISQVDISNNKNNIVLLNTKVLDLSSNLTIGLVDISNNRYNIGLLNTKVLDISRNLTTGLVDISNNRYNIGLLNTKVLDISINLTTGLVDISNNRYNIVLLNTKIVYLSNDLVSVHSQLNDTDTRSRNNRTNITTINDTTIPVAITGAIASSILGSGLASAIAIPLAISANNVIQGGLTTIAIASATSPLATSIGLVEADIIKINGILDPLAITVGEINGVVGPLATQVEEIQAAVGQIEITVGEHSTDLVLLKTKTNYMDTDPIITQTTNFRGCSVDIYNTSNERLIHISKDSNIFYTYIPLIVQFSSRNIFSIQAESVRIDTLPLYITTPVEIQNTLIQSGAVCILANNTRGFTSNLSIQNFNSEIIQTFKSSTQHNFFDASIIASQNTLASFSNFQPFDNGGTLEINADIINLNASVINLGNSRCQVNIAGRDFTEYFTQYRRTRNPVSP